MSVQDIIFAASGKSNGSKYSIIPHVVSYAVCNDKIYCSNSAGLVSYVDVDNLSLTPTPISNRGYGDNRLTVANNNVFLTENLGNIYRISNSTDELVISSVSNNHAFGYVRYDQITMQYAVITNYKLYLSDDGIAWRDSNINLPPIDNISDGKYDHNVIFYNGMYVYVNGGVMTVVNTNTGTIKVTTTLFGVPAEVSFCVFNSIVYASNDTYNTRLYTTKDFIAFFEIPFPSGTNVMFYSMDSVANNKMFFSIAYSNYKQTTAYMTDGNAVFHSKPIELSYDTKFYYSQTLEKYYALHIVNNELHIRESIDGLTWT